MKNNKSSRTIKVLIILSIFFAFFIKGIVLIDPDLGWRIKAGVLYLSEGIPTTDPFSYTMPSFPWVDHAWLTTLFIGWWDSLFGRVGLSFAFSAIATLVCVVGFTRNRNDMGPKSGVKGSLALLSSVILYPFFGIRAQIMTWLFFLLFTEFILNERLWQKYRIFTPLFFLVWANFHGGFALGLGVFGLVVLTRIIKKKRIDFIDAALVCFSIVITLVNPYGFGIWREVWSSVSDNSLRWNVQEWGPSFFRFDSAYTLLLVVSLVFVFIRRSQLNLERVVVYFVLLTQAIMSIRHIPLWTIAAFPVTLEALEGFYTFELKGKEAKERFGVAVKFFGKVVIVVVLLQFLMTLKGVSQMLPSKFYPQEAVSYLGENVPERNLFAPYDWGGYLIWKYPQKKVFVDGRMPSWKSDFAPGNESVTAFYDQRKVLSGEASFFDLVSKYDIDTVLWINYDNVEESTFLTMLSKKFFPEKDKRINLPILLEMDGWEKVYGDDVAVIYKKV